MAPHAIMINSVGKIGGAPMGFKLIKGATITGRVTKIPVNRINYSPIDIVIKENVDYYANI